MTVADTDELVDMLMEPDLYTVIGGAPEDRASAKGRVDRWIAGSPDGLGRWINHAVRLCATGELVGLCQATLSSGTRGGIDECVVAYLVHPRHHHRGIGTAMMSTFVGHMISTFAPRTVTAHIAPGHTPSERIAAVLGLTPTAATDDDGERIWSRERANTRL